MIWSSLGSACWLVRNRLEMLSFEPGPDFRPLLLPGLSDGVRPSRAPRREAQDAHGWTVRVNCWWPLPAVVGDLRGVTARPWQACRGANSQDQRSRQRISARQKRSRQDALPPLNRPQTLGSARHHQSLKASPHANLPDVPGRPAGRRNGPPPRTDRKPERFNAAPKCRGQPLLRPAKLVRMRWLAQPLGAAHRSHRRGQSEELRQAWVMFGQSWNGVARGMGIGLRVWGCGFCEIEVVSRLFQVAGRKASRGGTGRRRASALRRAIRRCPRR